MTSGEIYILYSCDEWKSWDSMRLVAATGSPRQLKKVLVGEIDKNNMEIESRKILSLPVGEIGSQLDYGHIQIVRDGEVQ